MLSDLTWCTIHARTWSDLSRLWAQTSWTRFSNASHFTAMFKISPWIYYVTNFISSYLGMYDSLELFLKMRLLEIKQAYW